MVVHHLLMKEIETDRTKQGTMGSVLSRETKLHLHVRQTGIRANDNDRVAVYLIACPKLPNHFPSQPGRLPVSLYPSRASLQTMVMRRHPASI